MEIPDYRYKQLSGAKGKPLAKSKLSPARNPEQVRMDEDTERRGNWRRWGPPTFPSGNGARYAKTTRPTAIPGAASCMTRRAARPTAGAKTGCWAYATANAACVLRLLYGTDVTRSSKNAYLG